MSIDKSLSPMTHKSLLKSGGVVSLGVLCSRILGFFRDVILAHLMGTGMLAEAFFVAQRIPNLLRDLAGEGAANAAIVPVLAEYKQKKSHAQWQELINVVMAWGIIILGAITVLGMVGAPWIVRVMAPGFADDAAKFQLTVDLTRIMFPYLVLIALTAFQMGILFSLSSFFIPAFGPCLLNMAMILSAWGACLFSWPLAYAIAVGVLIGGLWQFMAQWAALHSQGVHWQKPQSLNHEGAKKIGSLLIPRIWGSAVYQINIFVDTFCASLAFIVGSGGIAALYYSSRIVQFPLGVFGYALASVALPALSKSASDGNMVEFRSTLMFALRKLLLILVPCAALMMAASPWIIRVVFERGLFDGYSTQITSRALLFAAAGLPFYGAARILTSALYALQDTRAPVKAASICLAVNLALNFILMYPLKIGGIALASSIASMANCLLLAAALRKRHGLEIWKLKQK